MFRDGEVIWRSALGLADVARGEEATTEHAYRIGSITKTFTAVCILQLRDAMVLDLDDALRTHIPEAPVGLTIRDALAHLSGLQREPPGEIWESLVPPSREELLGGLEDAERVLRPGEAWHYSNLAFGLLGEVVMRRSDGGFEETLRTRVLEPLGLDRTGFDPRGPRATGYYVEPYTDRVVVEPDPIGEGPTAAIGWLWSTVDDLARFGDFLATGRDGVLLRETVDEMARVRTMVDEAGWTLGWGLGVGLYRRGERVYVGHGGAMPGFLAALCVHRPERTGAVVLVNTSAGAINTFFGEYINGSGEIELFQRAYGFGEPLITDPCPASEDVPCTSGTCNLCNFVGYSGENSDFQSAYARAKVTRTSRSLSPRSIFSMRS